MSMSNLLLLLSNMFNNQFMVDILMFILLDTRLVIQLDILYIQVDIQQVDIQQVDIQQVDILLHM